MLTMESGEWPIQCPVKDRRFFNRSAGVQCCWEGDRGVLKYGANSFSVPGEAFHFSV